MYRVLVALIFCLTSTIINAQDIIKLKKPVECLNLKIILDVILNSFEEKLKWVGKDEPSQTNIALFVNNNNGTWTIIQYDKEIACILGIGQGGNFI